MLSFSQPRIERPVSDLTKGHKQTFTVWASNDKLPLSLLRIILDNISGIKIFKMSTLEGFPPRPVKSVNNWDEGRMEEPSRKSHFLT